MPQVSSVMLKKGNKDFTEDKLTVRNNTEHIRKATLGQYPKAVILSCLDSRVPVEDVFHSGLGNFVVAKAAGNIVNDDILGSLEYACKVSGAKVIVELKTGKVELLKEKKKPPHAKIEDKLITKTTTAIRIR